MKIVIIGASHGGKAAAEAILLQDPNATITIIDQQATLHFDLGTKVTLKTATTVTALDATKHTITTCDQTKNDTTLQYDKLLLAPGADAFVPPFSGHDLPGVTPMRTREQINTIKQATKDPLIKHVVVIGGGYIGIGAADLFSQQGKQVTVIDNVPRILATYLDSEFTNQLEAELATNGVTFQLGQLVAGIEQTKMGKVVHTKEGDYPADLVVVAAGTRPNTAWLKDTLALTDRGLIKVDKFLQTSLPDVFAIGDAIAVNYEPLRQSQSVALASNAQRQGEIAALNLKQSILAYQGVLGTSAWQAGKFQFGATGLTEAAAKNAEITTASIHLTQQQATRTVQFKLTYDPNSQIISGAQVMADGSVAELINLAALAIQQEMTLAQLAQTDFYMQPMQNDQPHLLNEAAFVALRTY